MYIYIAFFFCDAMILFVQDFKDTFLWKNLSFLKWVVLFLRSSKVSHVLGFVLAGPQPTLTPSPTAEEVGRTVQDSSQSVKVSLKWSTSFTPTSVETFLRFFPLVRDMDDRRQILPTRVLIFQVRDSRTHVGSLYQVL